MEFYTNGTFDGMEEFQILCRDLLVEVYKDIFGKEIHYEDTFVVWSCKTLQNYKLLASTNVNGDGCYVEFTYNGDKKELYRDVYKKAQNDCIKFAQQF